MAYNRYMGNGRVVRMPDAPPPPASRNAPAGQPLSQAKAQEPPMKKRSGSLFPEFSGGLEGLLSKLKKPEWETEDLLLALILYLAYRESGDKELLIILGAMLFL